MRDEAVWLYASDTGTAYLAAETGQPENLYCSVVDNWLSPIAPSIAKGNASLLLPLGSELR